MEQMLAMGRSDEIQSDKGEELGRYYGMIVF